MPKAGSTTRKAGKPQGDAGKRKRRPKPNTKPRKRSRRPTLPEVEPLFSTYEQPKPAGAYYDKKAAESAVKFIENLRHFKGKWAGQRCLLMRWQLRIVRELFGWMRKDGTRLYRTCYVEAPRKSGKTTLAAGIALYLAHGDGEAAPEVYFAAYDKEQAKICYDTARYMLEQVPELVEGTLIYEGRREMVLKDNPGGFLRPLSRETAKQFGLNLHGLVFDELMTQKTRDMWNALTTSQGSRAQPLTFAISTAGWEQVSVCFEQHELTRQIHEGVLADESFLGVVYGAPKDADWTSEKVWKAANPSLGETAGLEFYRSRYTKASNQPTEQNAFRTLLLSQWVGQAERYFDMRAWSKCGGEPDDGGLAFGGLDLSATTDLTAFVVLNNEESVHLWAWLPEQGIRERERKDRVPYRMWAEQGHLTLTPGATIDYAYVKQTVREAAERFDLQDVSYDPWNATQLVGELEEEGITMVKLRQGFASLSAPTKELQRRVMEGQLRHGANPVLAWCASNTGTTTDPAGNVKPDRTRSSGRIDPVVALIEAIDGHSRRGRARESVYRRRRLAVA